MPVAMSDDEFEGLVSDALDTIRRYRYDLFLVGCTSIDPAGRLTNSNGVFVARAVVTHKLPDGICYVQHAQERTIDVPKSEATGKRGTLQCRDQHEC